MTFCETRLVWFFGPSICLDTGLLPSSVPDRGVLRTLSKLPTLEVTLLFEFQIPKRNLNDNPHLQGRSIDWMYLSP